MAAKSVSTIIFLLSAVNVLYGFKLAKSELDEPTEEDCMRPPIRFVGHECCRVPKERIWGDLRSSIHKCLRAHKPGYKPMGEGEDEQAAIPMNGENESTGTSPRPSDPSDDPRRLRGRFMRKSLSERIGELFTSLYKVVKNTIDALWQTVVIITDRLPRHQNDSCFMECVFEDQGFLMNKIVNEAALTGRLNRTLENNEPWHKVALAAVETCTQADLKIDTNSTCQSGSEEIFRCIFKYLFFNCPSWSQSQYCTSLKKFYEKCPNGPPPAINDNDHTSMPEETETLSTTESEKYSE